MSSRLRIAITQLIVDDWRLLTTREQDSAGTANEVALAFALGWHLKPLLDRRWDVDCEYNRATDDQGNSHVKTRESGQRVRPDLIVHRRRQRGPRNNLLVLELKTNGASQTHEGGSCASVADLAEQHGYGHGVIVDLGLSGRSLAPRWAWYKAKSVEGDGLWTDLCPVYSPEAVKAIVSRAETEEKARYAN